MNCYRKEKMNLFGAAFVAVSVLFLAACADEESTDPGDRENPAIHDTDVYTQAKSSDEYKNPDVEYGKMTDPRDGKVYRTVKIGNLEWMAENLNFSDSELLPNIADGNWCYEDDTSFCNVGGRLYTWTAAMNLSPDMQNASVWYYRSPSASERRGVCPEGWVVPSYSEFWSLVVKTGSTGRAGLLLKSTKGWRDGNVGKDTLGFTALPLGFYVDGKSYNAGFESIFWTSDEEDYGVNNARSMKISYDSDEFELDTEKKWFGFSVRCVKDTSVIRVAREDSVSRMDELERLKDLFDTAKVVKGTFVDPRDKREYRTVKIGDQTWMAENMVYQADDSVSACYARKDSLCKIYGRLYSYEFARDSVCPEGWTLPTRANYEVLRKWTGHADVVDIYYIDISALTLKSKETWTDYKKGGDAHDGSGLDLYGFGVLAGGRGTIGVEADSFFNRGESAHLWVHDNGDGYYFSIDFSNNDYSTGYSGRGQKGLASVRCIQGDKPVYYECPVDTSKYKVPSYTGVDSSITKGGYLQDLRNNKYYKVVTIGKQTWMAENLNIGVDEYQDRIACYRNDDEECDSLGTYFKWDDAMDFKSVFTSVDDYYCRHNEERRGVCPKGWHLPSEDEWRELIETVGDSLSANHILKSKNGWQQESGLDTYGFNAVSGGYNPGSRWSTGRERFAYFWSRTESSREVARGISFSGENCSFVKMDFVEKGTNMPVRCLKDEALLSEAVELVPYESPEHCVEKPVTYVFDDSVRKAASLYDEEKNTLLDKRDGRTYKTTKIGSQIWMAENLAFDYDIGSAKNFCIYSNADSCSKYGLYYTWSAAMDSAGEFRGNGADSIVRGICPSGWHLPSKQEWYDLVEIVTGEPFDQSYGYTMNQIEYTQRVLKSVDGWASSAYAGIDSVDFYGYPMGNWIGSKKKYEDVGSTAYYWSTESIDAKYASIFALHATNAYMLVHVFSKGDAIPVRCLKD
ncbi:hypothetical protein B7994_03430 [Fibrobacter sp. UWR2]|nr:hypothetical protein B7994_03430 [Fibrobacter sp. UWR2]